MKWEYSLIYGQIATNSKQKAFWNIAGIQCHKPIVAPWSKTIKLCLNNAIWLAQYCHVTCNIQSEWFISAKVV